ncbi:hypothetical protein [Marisediminicola sp. LYQ134]|uniref:hypothetical protein n=1 Tax=Marisediminicola sp. LYQ134 TaxID=3391061 RepID=UPI0039835CF3
MTAAAAPIPVKPYPMPGLFVTADGRVLSKQQLDTDPRFVLAGGRDLQEVAA